MKIILNVTLLCLSLTAYSQNFQPGYYINNEGNKVEVLIDNIEAIRNPESFRYKLSPDDQIKVKTIHDVQIFEILDTPYKFERAIVNLDLSEDNIKNLNANREPNFRQDTLFLKVSIEGKASLYVYQSPKLPIRFFYSMDNTKIEPLIFKKYLVDGTKININNRFKQQLINDLGCLSLNAGQLNNINYKETPLNDIFTRYNTCVDSSYVNFFKKKRKGELNLSLKAGVNYSSINFIQKEPFSNEQKLDSYLSPRIGVEIEYIIPVLNNMFSVISYPSFQYSRTSNVTSIYLHGDVPSNPGGRRSDRAELLIDYSRIILPLGLRSYYYQGENLALYLQGAAVMNLLTNPSGTYNSENFNTRPVFDKTTADPNIDLSTGVKYKKLSLEIVYSLHNFIKNTGFVGEIQNPFTLNLGYKILLKKP